MNPIAKRLKASVVHTVVLFAGLIGLAAHPKRCGGVSETLAEHAKVEADAPGVYCSGAPAEH